MSESRGKETEKTQTRENDGTNGERERAECFCGYGGV